MKSPGITKEKTSADAADFADKKEQNSLSIRQRRWTAQPGFESSFLICVIGEICG
jgi:hypothetical protein